MDKREIRIATPCTLDWQKMTPADKGRFCADCKKVVRDVSSMNEREARTLLRAPTTEGLCVRFLADRDGKVLFAGDPRIVPASLLSKTKRAAMLAAAVALPLAVNLTGCSAPLSPLGTSSDDTTTSNDPDSGVTENMGGATYDPDAGDPYATDAAADSAPADAAADAPPTSADAGNDARPDGAT